MTPVEPTTDREIDTTLLDAAWRTPRTPEARPAPEALAGAVHRRTQAEEQLAAHVRRGPQPEPELVSRADQARLPDVPFGQLAAVLGEHEHERVRLALVERVAVLGAIIEGTEVAMGLRLPAKPAVSEPDPEWLVRAP